MQYREIHPWFVDTFAGCYEIEEYTRVTLWNYLAYGLHPGGFVVSVLENNFLNAINCADHTWTGYSLKELGKWVANTMPIESYGTLENIINWMKKTDEERFEIMSEHRLRPSVVDVLSGAPA